MQKITNIISQEEYEKAIEHGAKSIIGDSIKQGYGVYNAKVFMTEDAYLLTYERGDTCD